MKRFIKNILIFSSLILLLGGVLEYMLRQTPNPFKYKTQLLAKHSTKTETLIFGSSVANCGIVPAYFPRITYNVAISGEWNRFNKMLLEKYIDKMPNLKTLVWGQCYHSLWMDDTDLFSERSIVDHKLYMGIEAENSWKYSSELISLKAMALRKWSKYYLLHQPTMHCDSTGLDHSFDREQRNSVWREEITKLVKDQTIDRMAYAQLYEENLQRVRKVAELCEAKGIKLFLVIPPVHPDFKAKASKEQMAQVDEGIGAIAEQWHHVYYLNYFWADGYDDDDFYNGNHLSSDYGALKFTEILLRDMESASKFATPIY